MDRPFKTAAASRTENVFKLHYDSVGENGRLFGGRLMAWIDETGMICATRHAQHPVTTAFVDDLEFRQSARINDLVVLVAKVTYVGNTSIEVRVDSYIEALDGSRQRINQAYLTYVTLDYHTGKPTPVPFSLKVTSPEEEAEWEHALQRKKLNHTRAQEGF